jgi:tetratricopeptide (TPR) repeat protein
VKDDRPYLADVLQALERVEEIGQRGRAAFLADWLLQDAAIRNFEIVGEAVKRVSEELKAAHPEIPWADLAVRALALAPRCPLMLWGLAGTYHMLGEMDEAVVMYQRLIRRGAPRIATGRCGEGLRWARGMVADCWYRLGEIREALGQRGRAVTAYRKHLAARRGGASIYDAGVVRQALKAFASRAPASRKQTTGAGPARRPRVGSRFPCRRPGVRPTHEGVPVVFGLADLGASPSQATSPEE